MGESHSKGLTACRLLLATTAALLLAIPASRAETRIERTWSDGPMPVSQIVRDNGDRLCYFYQKTDTKFFSLSYRADGRRIFVFRGEQRFTTGHIVTVNIDSRPFSLNMQLHESGTLFVDVSDNADFLRALQNGHLMIVIAGLVTERFDMDGAAIAMTVMNRCGENLTASAVVPPPAPAPAPNQTLHEFLQDFINRGQRPPAAVMPVTGRVTVPMRARHGGGYDVTVTINGAVPLSFELDTGASDMSIPEAVIDRMLQNGTLSVASFEGIRHYKMANGAVEISRTYRLASVTIGGRTVTDVLCSTGIDKNTFLLGQSFLRKFKSWSINNEDNLLILD